MSMKRCRDSSHVLTFAISLQLFPASLIALSLCSSSGVQGVFVRPFFFPLSVGVMGVSVALPDCSSPAGAVGEVRVGDVAVADERRFRAVGGEGSGGAMAALPSDGF